MIERSYLWGKFQGWGAVLFAVAQFVLVPFPLSLLVGLLVLSLGVGLLRKRRYGFVLVYVVAGVSLVAGLVRLTIEPTGDAVSQFVIAMCFWGIPAAFYYPKRYREFGFGKPTEAPAADPRAVAPTAAEPRRLELTDEERETVLQHMRERLKPQEPTP